MLKGTKIVCDATSNEDRVFEQRVTGGFALTAFLTKPSWLTIKTSSRKAKYLTIFCSLLVHAKIPRGMNIGMNNEEILLRRHSADFKCNSFRRLRLYDRLLHFSFQWLQDEDVHARMYLT